ncbi:MAG: phosphatase PAP2 family protein [Methanobrevibacter sp.]|nr:phosphatase PAP2 family protein [Candidatus Methanoflexus mossambicus]
MAAVFIAYGNVNIRGKAIKLAWILMPLVGVIGFSRIYLGDHYPFDIIGGAIVGIFAGLIATKIGEIYLNKFYFFSENE